MNTNNPTIPTVNINGQEVPNFADVQSTTELAIVSLNVINKLAALLPQASLGTIKRELREQLDGISTMEQYINVLQNEIDFHRTVNLIQSYEAPVYQEAVAVNIDHSHSH